MPTLEMATGVAQKRNVESGNSPSEESWSNKGWWKWANKKTKTRKVKTWKCKEYMNKENGPKWQDVIGHLQSAKCQHWIWGWEGGEGSWMAKIFVVHLPHLYHDWTRLCQSLAPEVMGGMYESYKGSLQRYKCRAVSQKESGWGCKANKNNRCSLHCRM